MKSLLLLVGVLFCLSAPAKDPPAQDVSVHSEPQPVHTETPPSKEKAKVKTVETRDYRKSEETKSKSSESSDFPGGWPGTPGPDL